jgi:outer membrane protein assembly factor BamB
MPSLAAPASGYTVEGKIHLAGNQGWDLLAVDDSTGRIFLSHGDRIEVVDAATGKLLGTVPGIQGAHGVALATSVGKGFATSGKDSTVVVFDPGTYAVIERLPAGGAKPDAIAFEPATGRIFVGLAGSDQLAVVDAASSKMLGTISLEGNPEMMAFDGKGMLYVAVEDKSQVVAIDARTLKVVSTWSLAPGKEPTGLAMDASTGRIFAGCANHLMVVLDASSGAVVAKLPIGEHIDGVAFDAGLDRAYASGGDGTLTAVQEESPGKFRVLATVTTKKGARTVALDAKTHHLYLPTADFGPVPPPTADKPKPRPPVLEGTFTVLDVHPM